MSLERAGAGPWALELPAGSRWSIRAQAPGFWIRGTDLAVGAMPPEPVTLSAWRLGTIRGAVAIDGPPRKQPKALLLTTLKPRPSLGLRDAPKFQLECPLDEQGRFACEIPAALYDLGLSLEGSSPIYRWNLAVSAQTPLDLGSLRFRSGGSVAGWIEVPGGTIDAKTCQARLIPTISPLGTQVDVREKSAQRELAAPCRPEGLFQLAGLPPGLYDLSISQLGYTSFRQPGIAVFRDAESFLQRAAVLRKPLRLRLRVVPALDPYGKPWRVRGFQREEGGSASPEAFSGVTDESGALEREAVQPGFYRLEAESSQGERMSVLFDVPLEGNGEAFAEIRVDWIDLAGRLLVGGQGHAGTLWFGGRQGMVSLMLQADEEGRFAGVLPLQLGNRWWVDIETSRQKVRRWVQVTPNARRKARLEIDLPDNRVFGRVLDAAGQPVRGAQVQLESLRPGQAPELPESVETAEGGIFEVRSLVPGRISLQAEGGAPNAFSEQLEIDLEKDGEVGPLELRLREGRAVKGRLVGPFGPVAGAPLLAFAFPVPRSLAEGRTDAEGRFQLRVPKEGLGALVVASAPGLALTAFLVPNEKTDIDLEVAGKGGTLELVLPGPARRDPSWLTGTLEQNGLLLPLFTISRWASGAAPQPQATEERVTFLVPQVAPGSYRLCLSPEGDLPPPPPSARCVSGTLEAGGFTRLDLAETTGR